MPREDRDIVRLAGIGGHVMPFKFNPDDTSEQANPYAGLFLEITRWEVLHENIIVEDPHSGSGGAILRALVAQDWVCQFTLPWNARLEASRDKESVGFLEEILVGRQNAAYNVSILFAIGDSLTYNTFGAGGPDERAALFAKKMLLRRVRMINSNDGRGIVRFEAHGEGNSLLQGFRGNTQKFNLVTEPAEPANPAGF